jgi:hypothetical protein
MELFPELKKEEPKQFVDFAESNDKAVALKHLQQLTPLQIQKEVLHSGYSSLFTRDGKPALMDYAIKQTGKKTPSKREFN